MSSWRSPPQGPLLSTPQIPENGPRAKCDQVVFEAIAKAAEIVVGSRCWIENVPGSSSSSRFNITVPEVQGVRSILQRWKRALHVPLRLDVYYQHEESSKRELLERWCLEYAPKTTYSFQHSSSDPIVQLRQVCKQIVIWLRTLYGWSRMLPAQALRTRKTVQANNNIGFSIYVVSEGNDDVTGLVANQGFQSQAQPQSVLTPYGELGWKVFYSPKSMIQKFLPQVPAYTTTPTPIKSLSKQELPQANTSRTVSQPIPMNGPKNLALQTSSGIARSAPVQQQHPIYHRSNSESAAGLSVPKQHAPMMTAAMRSNSGLPTFKQQQQQEQQEYEQFLSVAQPTTSDATTPPKKNLSALSLAMLMMDEGNGTKQSEGRTETFRTASDEAKERRRSALHHVPPQFVSNSPKSPALKPVSHPHLATAGEYGYAYNNHIPTINKHNMPLEQTTSEQLRSASPNPMHTPLSLASTPPKGFFLGSGPTPPNSLPAVSSLIPPRSAVASPAVTPPFVRPAGFVGEPPSQPLPPAAMASSFSGQAASKATTPTASQTSLNHQTSLDLLHSSPFQKPASVFSLSANNGNGINWNDLRPTQGSGSSGLPYRPEEYPFDSSAVTYDDTEENYMPFAVDSVSQISNAADVNHLSSGNVASFCTAPHRRLALFESTAAELSDQQDVLDSLTDQLEEFKTFGASLLMGNSGEGSSSTSTPISIR